MNKKIFIALLAVGFLFFALIILTIVLSFTFVKKNTDNLIKIQRDKLVSIIRIPNAVPPSNPSFHSIRYTWEMETREREVAAVNVLQTTGLSRGDDSIFIILEKTTGGDESIFDKILPSVIADEEVLRALYSQEETTLLSNGSTGFKSARIERNATSDKVTKITWEFERDNFGQGAKNYFEKFNAVPQPLIKTLYLIQNVIIASLSGQ